MPIEMMLWRMTPDGPRALEFSALGFEKQLEDMIVEDPGTVGLDLLIIGRQIATAFGGFVDVMGLDSDGRVHILELKRDRTPRDVVAQTLDYASWAQDLTVDEIEELYRANHPGAELDEAFAEQFAQPLPDVVNADQQLTIVASSLDPVSERIVAYLADRYGVPVNVAFFRHFSDDGARWLLAKRFGLLSAGGGSWYWKPLRNLSPDARVFAYVGGAGYVGIGTVTGEMRPARDAVVRNSAGIEVPLIECDELPESYRASATVEDEDKGEYVVPVTWDAAVPLENAVSEPGLFASQVTACKLRDPHTVESVVMGLDVNAD